MRERNRNIDIIRAIMILWIALYHAWVVCGAAPFSNSVADTLIRLGGEIGVTGFFMLSGFGIYYSLSSMEGAGKFDFKIFMKKRFQRILPQYYISLIFVILFMGGAEYLAKMHVWNLVSHVFLIHNLFPNAFGAINGVLWTMGVIVQFYIVSIFLYRGIKKWKLGFVGIAIVITVLSKALVINYLIPNIGDQYMLYGSRQLLSALDNFVWGMFIAFWSEGIIIKKKWRYGIISFTGIVLLELWGNFGLKNGIYVNRLSGYIWHSVVACILTIIFLSFIYLPLNYEKEIVKRLLWISKYEYGIYLWHLVMFRNLYERAPIIQSLLQKGMRWIVFVVFLVLSVFVGWLFSVIIDEWGKDKWVIKRSI